MERIHVSVRARPLSAEDAKTSPWRISGNSISTVNQSANFVFDRIFGEECKTREVYEDKTKQLVAAAVAGFNGTVFAYGQTNSGKTHTMRGSVSEPGVIPLAVRELFDILQEDVDREFLLRMSYMEIYNEEINDLLVPEHRKLQIHESLERGIFVAGLREEIVTCPEQVLNFMEFGETHRHIGETNMNVYSSRSHTIFRMIIESRHRVEDGDPGNVCDAVRVSVLNLVDLAGSERAAKTGAEGVRLKEGSHINRSLMTLGTVINKLSEGVECHVPYRDSKLTRILQPSLGGNANTAIICNITLAQVHADETKSSLQFASRALRVTNCAHVNEILTDAALLKRQKKEIEELRAKLLDSPSDHFEEEILNLRNTLLQSELEKERIALELQAEKKAQAQRERRLQEQAKKIANLSFMILNTKKDDIDDEKQQKMVQRRKTWCPTPLSRESRDATTPIAQDADGESAKAARDITLSLSFDELVDESSDDRQIDEHNIPDANLRNITKRRRVPSKEKSSISVNPDLIDMQEEYEKLLQKFETELTTKDIEIECLKKRLAESEQCADMSSVPHPRNCPNTPPGIKTLTSRESKAIYAIKQLEEQIETLEREKSSVQATLDSVVELATEQKRSASEKFDKVHQELLDAREEAQLVTEQLYCFTSSDVFEKLKSCEAEILSLSKDLYEARHEMESCREKCKVLSRKLSLVEENAESEKKCSREKAMENARLMNILKELENERHKYQEVQNSEVLNLKSKQELLHAENEKLKKDAVENNKEKARLSLMLRSTRAKLEAATGRYRETVEERELMHEKFKLASKELKEELEIVVKENLHLKKLRSHH